MQDKSGAGEIQETLRGALVGYEVSMDRLRAAVIGFVKECRERGLSAEQMVPQVRRLLERIPRWSQPSDDESLPADMTVVDRAVQWAIESYYEAQMTHEDESRIA